MTYFGHVRNGIPSRDTSFNAPSKQNEICDDNRIIEPSKMSLLAHRQRDQEMSAAQLFRKTIYRNEERKKQN